MNTTSKIGPLVSFKAMASSRALSHEYFAKNGSLVGGSGKQIGLLVNCYVGVVFVASGVLRSSASF